MGSQQVMIAIVNHLTAVVRKEPRDCVFAGKHFAVHRPFVMSRSNEWQITHRHTGFKAGPLFKTRREAIEYAEWLEKRGTRLGVRWGSKSGKALQRGQAWEALKTAVQRRNKKMAGVC